MTNLDDVIRKHIAHIVSTEKRPFSFVDFLTFEVDQQHYKMSHGTFRNKISAMLKTEEIEVAYYSKQAF
jgi:abortive infection bacteriophage resistance protein